jgi:hypothetical protein
MREGLLFKRELLGGLGNSDKRQLWRKTWPQMDQLRSLSSREFRH